MAYVNYYVGIDVVRSKRIADMPKYEVVVANNINCSSTGHYYVLVTIDGGDKRDARYFDIQEFFLMHKNDYLPYHGYPQYVYWSIAYQLKTQLDSGTLKVYEYNQDKRRRYKDLRYHNQEHLEHLINHHYERLCVNV